MIAIYSLIPTKSWQNATDNQQRFYKAGLPVYPSITRAVSAIDKLIRYYEEGRSPRVGSSRSSKLLP